MKANRQSPDIVIACSILAALAFFSACILLRPPAAFDTLLGLIPDVYENWIAWGMLLDTILLVAALVMPCRTLRHWGLVLGLVCWASLVGVFISVWFVRFAAFFAFTAGAAHFVTLLVDVRKKPRCKARL